MATLTLNIGNTLVGHAWGNDIVAAGFDRDEIFERKKKIVIWSKDGIDYTASTSRDSEQNLIITLTERK